MPLTLTNRLPADGALLGLWSVWRAGYRIVDFVHDQVVVEVEADQHMANHRDAIEQLMIGGMKIVAPDLLVKVESVVTRSLNKNDKVDVAEFGEPSSVPAGVAA